MPSSRIVLDPSITHKMGLGGVEIQTSLLVSHVSPHRATSTQASSFINFHKGSYELQEGLGKKPLLMSAAWKTGRGGGSLGGN